MNEYNTYDMIYIYTHIYMHIYTHITVVSQAFGWIKLFSVLEAWERTVAAAQFHWKIVPRAGARQCKRPWTDCLGTACWHHQHSWCRWAKVCPTNDGWHQSAMSGKISRSQSIHRNVVSHSNRFWPWYQASVHLVGYMAVPWFLKYEASRCPHYTVHLVKQCGRGTTKKSVAVIKSGQG